MKFPWKKTTVYLTAILLSGAMIVASDLYIEQSKEQSVNKMALATTALKSPEQESVRVKTITLFSQNMSDVMILPGSVEANEDILLGAKSDGIIEVFNVEEGDHIKAGDTILELDNKIEKAVVAQAEACLEKAQLNLERIQQMAKANVIGQADLDNALTDMHEREAILQAEKQRLANKSLSAPITGIVDRCPMDKGEYVTAGEHILTLVDIDTVKVVVNIPEKDILSFQKGQKATVYLDPEMTKQCVGPIEFVALTADPITRTYPIKIRLDNKDHQLRPGMILRTRLVKRVMPEAIALPFFAVLDQPAGPGVYIIKEGHAKFQPVKTGIINKGMIEIRDGLNVGDQLVVVGQRGLSDGARIEVVGELTDQAHQFLESGGDLSTLSPKDL